MGEVIKQLALHLQSIIELMQMVTRCLSDDFSIRTSHLDRLHFRHLKALLLHSVALCLSSTECRASLHITILRPTQSTGLFLSRLAGQMFTVYNDDRTPSRDGYGADK